jgi:D-serine deaminase-like pyridoxal phosphate-dependent protein
MISITKPTLFIQPDIIHRNIKKMLQKAKDTGAEIRPHFKTHQSLAIGRSFKEYDIKKIAVSSVDMAEYFAKDGWKDITIAFPFNPNEIDKVNLLAEENVINLTLLNTETISYLNDHLKKKIGVFIEIDTGYRRSGISYHAYDYLQKMADLIQKSDKLILRGILSHAGQTYQAKSKKEILKIHQENIQRMSGVKKALKNLPEDFIISTGDTPSCSIAEHFENINEIRPGNFVFYDVQQAELGSCKYEDIAICMACPVVAKYKERNEIVVYGGAVHFSKEFILKDNQKIYGYIADLQDNGWELTSENGLLIKLSQEHGTIRVSDSLLEKYRIGDFIGILPIHSCLTANLMGEYFDFLGNYYDHLSGTKRKGSTK